VVEQKETRRQAGTLYGEHLAGDCWRSRRVLVLVEAVVDLALPGFGAGRAPFVIVTTT
jgi:hypothetical protein